MAEDEKTTFDLESNLKRDNPLATLSANEKRRTKSMEMEINALSIKKLVEEDNDSPSLRPYFVPFMFVCFVALVWFGIVIAGISKLFVRSEAQNEIIEDGVVLEEVIE